MKSLLRVERVLLPSVHNMDTRQGTGYFSSPMHVCPQMEHIKLFWMRYLTKDTYINNTYILHSHDTTVGKVTGIWVGKCGVQTQRVKRFSSSPKCPDQLWGPTNLVHNVYRGPFEGVQWPRHSIRQSTHLATRLWMSTAIPLPPYIIHSVDRSTALSCYPYVLWLREICEYKTSVTACSKLVVTLVSVS
jgi:hypothetical protein